MDTNYFTGCLGVGLTIVLHWKLLLWVLWTLALLVLRIVLIIKVLVLVVVGFVLKALVILCHLYFKFKF